MIGAIFSGQGSQRPAMGETFAADPVWRLVEEATEVLGTDVGRLLLHAGEAELRQTYSAQVAVFVTSVMRWKLLTDAGVWPRVIAGHSVGELAGLVAAGSLTFEAGLRLVARRAEAMTEACREHPGRMVAVWAPEDDVRGRFLSPGTWIAAINAPRQAVIAGSEETVEAVVRALRKARVPHRSLAVAGAFHTPLMAEATEIVRQVLSGLRMEEPLIPVVANLDAQVHDEASTWRECLSDAISSPVLWSESMTTLERMGVDCVLDLGTGVLAAATRESLDQATVLTLADPKDLRAHARDLLGCSADRVPSGGGPA